MDGLAWLHLAGLASQPSVVISRWLLHNFIDDLLFSFLDGFCLGLPYLFRLILARLTRQFVSCEAWQFKAMCFVDGNGLWLCPQDSFWHGFLDLSRLHLDGFWLCLLTDFGEVCEMATGYYSVQACWVMLGYRLAGCFFSLASLGCWWLVLLDSFWPGLLDSLLVHLLDGFLHIFIDGNMLGMLDGLCLCLLGRKHLTETYSILLAILWFSAQH